MLSIRNLTKTYKGGKVAVNDLSLEVENGDIFGFIGHNGAGKSTTIKAVVGTLPFEGGEIYVDGISIKERPVDCKRLIAFVPDNPDLYEHLTGLQYIKFVADIFKVPTDERISLTEKYADVFGLKDDLGNLIGAYSHGMKQKLALIAALIHKPKLMVLDEPFVGLDPRAAYALKSIMAEVCKDGGAIFFSTHVLEVAEKLCNKIAIIKDGRLVASGPTEAVLGGKELEDVFLELTE